MAERVQVSVVGVPIDSVTWSEAIDRIMRWDIAGESRVVCICNVHSVITARRDSSFFEAVASADLATPDGAPIAWMLFRLTSIAQKRINGPDLMWSYCEEAQRTGRSIYLYGGTQVTLDILSSRLRQEFPSLDIAGQYSPPFRALTPEEDEAVVRRINESGAGTIWVSLGCPKQEKWMIEHRGRINSVMVGVGAAFDYHAGTLKRAPRWMQESGLEWLYRLASEPRRLWRRYLVTNSIFLWRAASQLLMFQFANAEKTRLK